MPEDLENLIRRAMKALDDQVPSGYFDSLPQRTLARLEAEDMQSGTQGTTQQREASSGVPPQREEEDSGLHDIRALAQSTKTRLSSKRVSTSPPTSDEDVLATSSAGWKAVALPEPAKMVSLPELDELPAKKTKAGAKEKATAVEARFATRVAAPKKSKAPVVIGIGLGLAAAAGVGFYVMTQNNEVAKGTPVAIATQPELKSAPVAAPTTPPAPAPAQQIAASEPAPQATTEAPKPEPEPAKIAATTPPAKSTKTALKQKKASPPDDKADKVAKPDAKNADSKNGKKDDTGAGSGAEPSFDQLLKEAGVDETKKAQKPKLDKKELSADDFKRGIGVVNKRAQSCYKGTQGTAVVKLTIAPSGSVSTVTVSGMFAGKPEGDCVSKAAKAASFPAWDGAPQSFTYSWLLAE